MIFKLTYALYGVIKCSKFPSFTWIQRRLCTTYHLRHWWHFAQNHDRHRSSAASVHQHNELCRSTVAFLLICCSQAGSDLLGAKDVVKW